MKEEYILGWLERQMKVMDNEIVNLAKWVSQAQKDLEKSIQELSGLEYRLEGAKALRSYMDELKRNNQ